jgi:peptide/nickel transport system ATP-binding protein
VKAGLIRHKVGAIHAVSNVTFSINEGETFGLVGESGCGKTTIGRMVVGLEMP